MTAFNTLKILPSLPGCTCIRHPLSLKTLSVTSGTLISSSSMHKTGDILISNYRGNLGRKQQQKTSSILIGFTFYYDTVSNGVRKTLYLSVLPPSSHPSLSFFAYFLLCSNGMFSPWEKRVTFPEESRLRQSGATQP